MTQYNVKVTPSSVTNFYTVVFAVDGVDDVWEFSDIPYRLAFGSVDDPERSLVVLRAYEAFEAFILLDDPATEASELLQRLEKLKELIAK
jgi:hypothetical protein